MTFQTMKLALSVILCTSTLVLASNVVELDPENWDHLVGTGKSGLVNFYSKECNHCQNLEPVYDQLADTYAHAQDTLFIGRIEAAKVGRSIKKRYGVTQYPTLKWFSANGTVEDQFHSMAKRTIHNMAHFVYKNSNVRSNLPPLDYLTLDATTFDDVVMDPTKNVLVAFTAQWCQHCTDMKPAFERVANIVANEPNIVLANVEGPDEVNSRLMERFKIKEYPTLLFFSKDNKEPEEYIYGLDESQFIEFLNLKCGLQRAPTGGLNDEAGRIPQFDALAREFRLAPTDRRPQVYQKAVDISDALSLETPKHYLQVMKDLLSDNTDDWLHAEAQRLDTILRDGSVSHKGADAVKVKANILRVFCEEGGEKSDQSNSETVRKASGEL
ncbi:protein disulfide isomerase [Moniliophthora roreri MCA 2997]|uniref:protein disulfide-isomerase n=1 Tax=Moniliophthora roreri (strain MCA 2997) TaxID=1381753 RepID=V2XP87_MONRO|nr:protein disulfide isomerase [Moniliophthora roreri MCA 2997]